MTFVPRNLDQNKRIHGLANQNGIDRETLHDHAHTITAGRTAKTSELSFDEANVLIKRLGGEPLPATAALSTRSQQRARQKAGVKQMITPGQNDKIQKLWYSVPGRTPDGLTAITERTIKKGSPRTTEDANKVIEAIKSINSRPRRSPEKEAA
ncbi:MAG: hypothetical protein ACJ79X_06800 [Gemmatimonadaceae bacterium]|jgi:hypothetical protein